VYGALGFHSNGPTPLTFTGFDALPPSAHIFPSILHKDAFLLFRALCKLSMKGLQDESGSPNDPMALQNK